MQVDNTVDDDQARETYNFPPGAFGLVYRAQAPDRGGVEGQDQNDEQVESTDITDQQAQLGDAAKPVSYEIKAMKWGLIPFWTKRSPDYGSMLRTINCRDDSLIENKGMWNTMKQRKRCIVVAQGFFEWLKKGPNGKEKIPHFVKRSDGQLMCFAGLWDCVKYEDSEEKLYTYTVITTDSNKQLSFLHDRMPVILDPNSDAMKLWLDASITTWSADLQNLLKPYSGPLECYPVDQGVGKVGNNSPSFIVPVDSKENKKNIANFFGNAQKKAEALKEDHAQTVTDERDTKDHESSENHAPMPVPAESPQQPLKRKLSMHEEGKSTKLPKLQVSPATKQKHATPVKKTRSATSNEGLSKKPSPAKADSTLPITSFFGRK